MVILLNIEQFKIKGKSSSFIEDEISKWNKAIGVYRDRFDETGEIIDEATDIYFEYLVIKNISDNLNANNINPLNLNKAISFIGRIKGFFKKVGTKIKNLGIEIWKKLNNALNEVSDWILNNIQNLWKIFSKVGLDSIDIKLGLPPDITLTFKKPN